MTQQIKRWFSEYQLTGEDGIKAEWVRIKAGPWPSEEKAKSACKKHLEANRSSSNQLAFRIVRDDPRGTVEYECHPPHAWRMRWHVSRW